MQNVKNLMFANSLVVSKAYRAMCSFEYVRRQDNSHIYEWHIDLPYLFYVNSKDIE